MNYLSRSFHWITDGLRGKPRTLKRDDANTIVGEEDMSLTHTDEIENPEISTDVRPVPGVHYPPGLFTAAAGAVDGEFIQNRHRANEAPVSSLQRGGSPR